MRIILDRTKAGFWVMDIDNVTTIPLCISAATKAGDVAAFVTRCNPRAKIGIRSRAIGPEVTLAYGEVLWLKDGWNAKSRDPGDVHGEQ